MSQVQEMLLTLAPRNSFTAVTVIPLVAGLENPFMPAATNTVNVGFKNTVMATAENCFSSIRIFTFN